jgi:hypothetical protein
MRARVMWKHQIVSKFCAQPSSRTFLVHEQA